MNYSLSFKSTKKLETILQLKHILLRESEKDGTKTEMKIMYSIFEKITFGAVALGVTLLILFMNSTKDIQLGSALSETDPVVSQEVATVSAEAVEPKVESTVDATEDNDGPELRTLAGGATETQDAFVKTIKLFAFVLALYALSVRRRGLCFHPWLDSSILRVKLTEIRYKVLNDRYMR